MTNRETLRSLAELGASERRIIDRLDRSGSCWLWTGALDDRGRGRVSYHGRNLLHHRAVWEILVGPIPAGALLCHHCDNPTCANPDHLYVGDHRSNVMDMFSRGRHWTQTEPERAKVCGSGTFGTEGYAILREARRAGPDHSKWPRISPDEAKAITDDLRRANELAEQVHEFVRTHLEKEASK